jgi:hypothetical protein
MNTVPSPEELKKLFNDAFARGAKSLYPQFAKFFGLEVVEQLGKRYAASIGAIFTRNAGVWITKLIILDLLQNFPDAKYGAIVWAGKMLGIFLRGPKGKLLNSKKKNEEDEDDDDEEEEEEEEVVDSIANFRLKLDAIGGMQNC